MNFYPKVRLLIVGLNAVEEQHIFVGHMNTLGQRGVGWRDGCRAVPSFDMAIGMLNGCIGLELVHIHRGGDIHETGAYTSLLRHCTTLAGILSRHPRSPWLNLNGACFNFLMTTLGRYPHVRIGTFEDIATERWELFGPHQRIDEQF